jgi:UDP-glucose 4-epimerase
MILITGGAGYIGSQTNKHLTINGHSTIVYDNLSYGHLSSVKWGEFIEGDLNDIDQLRNTFRAFDINSVVHLAAYTYVGESELEPEKYYFNNVVNTLNLLKVMKEFGVDKIVFSSTCATYGIPNELPLTEEHHQNPINTYGKTKLMIEKILSDYSNAYNLKYVILRYFNVAGADASADIGENHDPETHLIPIILDVAIEKRESIKIFGSDYDTIDGTAVRDYIHVADIADAHVLAMKYLNYGGKSDAFNLGNGSGYSVKEVIDVSKKITKRNILSIQEERRPGDQDKLIGSSAKAKKIIGWSPKYTKLDDIIETAWKWHKKALQQNND